MGDKNTIVQEAPNLNNQPNIKLDLKGYEALVWQKGYNVFHDKLIKCPCQVQDNQPKPDDFTTKNESAVSGVPDAFGQHFNNTGCKNCNATGYVLINRIRTKMLLQGMNLDTRFKEWSEERTGTVKITCLEQDRISLMDRIINLDSESSYNETISFEDYKGKRFSYLIYEPKKVLVCFLYQGDNKKLLLLKEGVDFEVMSNVFTLNEKYFGVEVRNLRVTIKYTHFPMFHVIDMLRDVISQESRSGEVGKTFNFPLHAIGRRSHYVLDAENFSQDLLLDNSQNCDIG